MNDTTIVRFTDNRDHAEVEESLRAQIQVLKTEIAKLRHEIARRDTIIQQFRAVANDGLRMVAEFGLSKEEGNA